MLKYLLLTIVLTTNALAADFGIAFLAAQHKKFPAKECAYLANKLKRPYISFLWKSFGTKDNCIKEFIKAAADKPHTIQIYASNEVCRRWGNCQPYEFLPNLDVDAYTTALKRGNRKVANKVKKNFRKIKRFADLRGNHNTRWLLVPTGLESQHDKEAAKKLIELAEQEGWSKDNLVYNPVVHRGYQGDDVGAYYHETHGVHASERQARGIVSFDGAHDSECGRGRPEDKFSQGDLRSWISRHTGANAYVAYWCSEHQGLFSDTVSAPPVRDRTPVVSSRDTDRVLSYLPASMLSDSKKEEKQKKSKKKLGCDVMESFDGSGRTVVKESEHSGLVVVFHPKFQKRFSKVIVEAPDKQRTKLKWSGMGNPYNGVERQHWRNSKHWNQFKDNSVLKAVEKKRLFFKKVYCWQLGKAGQRHD